MRATLIIVFTFLLSYSGNSQQFEADSICYINTYTNTKVRCYVPSLDPGTSAYNKDLWEISRNGDFIKITHWLERFTNGMGVSIITHIQIVSRGEEEISYITPDKKGKRSKQYLQGNATQNSREFEIGLTWDLYDTNNDGIWDRLAIYWDEGNSPLVRVLYCHVK